MVTWSRVSTLSGTNVLTNCCGLDGQLRMSALQAVKRFRIRELRSVTPPAPTPAKSIPKAKLSPHPASSARNKAPVASIENPFLPKLSAAGRWAPPKYSLRRQAVLIKKARESGTLGLLPPGPKFSAAEIAAAATMQVAAQPPVPEKFKAQSVAASWTRQVEWIGEVKEKKVVGAEVGNRLYAGKKRMFKGHKWQRVAEKREKRRALLMRSMPKRIKEFKQVRLFWCFSLRYHLTPYFSITRGDVHTLSNLPGPLRTRSFLSSYKLFATCWLIEYSLSLVQTLVFLERTDRICY